MTDSKRTSSPTPSAQSSSSTETEKPTEKGDRLIKIKTSDGQEMDIPFEVAKQWRTFKTMFETKGGFFRFYWLKYEFFPRNRRILNQNLIKKIAGVGEEGEDVIQIKNVTMEMLKKVSFLFLRDSINKMYITVCTYVLQCSTVVRN